MPVRVAFHSCTSPFLKRDSSWMTRVAQGVRAASLAFADEAPVELLSDVRLFLDIFLSHDKNDIEFENVPVGPHIGRIKNPTAPITATIRYFVRDLKDLSNAEIATMLDSDCHGIVRSVVQRLRR